MEWLHLEWNYRSVCEDFQREQEMRMGNELECGRRPEMLQDEQDVRKKKIDWGSPNMNIR